LTPAIDLVVRQHIEHEVHTYQHDPNTNSYGMEAAERLGVDAARVFKTLVVELSDGDLAVGVVPVLTTLNLKKLAKAIEVKNVSMADPQKVQRVTGYLLGGVSPIAQKKSLTTIIDDCATSYKSMYVSAGKRGLEIELSATDLAHLCGARFASISAN